MLPFLLLFEERKKNLLDTNFWLFEEEQEKQIWWCNENAWQNAVKALSVSLSLFFFLLFFFYSSFKFHSLSLFRYVSFSFLLFFSSIFFCLFLIYYKSMWLHVYALACARSRQSTISTNLLLMHKLIRMRKTRGEKKSNPHHFISSSSSVFALFVISLLSAICIPISIHNFICLLEAKRIMGEKKTATATEIYALKLQKNNNNITKSKPKKEMSRFL